jgi:hypothetical protein
MTLDVYDIVLGPDAKMPTLDADNLGIVAVQMLDAVQTIVDVLTDNDGGNGWKVTFDPGMNAYTDRSEARHIVVSGKPLLDAVPGSPMTKVAAIMTGFAVHEVGHTKLNFYDAVRDRWPGKQLPLTLTNIIEDVVLEARTVERYDGFADHGNGNIFAPTLEYVADLTCPKYPLKWDGSSGHKVNVTGQIVRYRDYVSFDSDPNTQRALDFVETWAKGMTADLTPKGAVALVEQWLDFVQTTLPETPEEPPVDLPKGEFPTTDGPTIPNEDDDESEGPKGKGKSEPKDDDGEAEDGDDEGGTEGEGDSEDDESEDGGTEGGEDGDDEDGGTDGPGGDGEGRDGDGNDADTMNRGEATKGTNDSLGAGGSGQSVAEAGDEDPDADFDPADLDKSFDDIAKPDNSFQQTHLDKVEKEERVTTRVDAGQFGKMRVIFR